MADSFILSANKDLIIGLPFRGHDAEEYKIFMTGIPDILACSWRDQNELACMDLLVFRTDVHLAAPAQEIVEFRRGMQDVGECRLTRRDNGMGDTASQLPGPCHVVRVEELAEERSVDNAFMTAAGDVSYNHANSHPS